MEFIAAFMGAIALGGEALQTQGGLDKSRAGIQTQQTGQTMTILADQVQNMASYIDDMHKLEDVDYGKWPELKNIAKINLKFASGIVGIGAQPLIDYSIDKTIKDQSANKCMKSMVSLGVSVAGVVTSAGATPLSGGLALPLAALAVASAANSTMDVYIDCVINEGAKNLIEEVFSKGGKIEEPTVTRYLNKNEY